jgi:hypothetical protein
VSRYYTSYEFELQDEYTSHISIISINVDTIAIKKIRDFIRVFRNECTNKILLNKKCIGERNHDNGR